jgi:predicted dehydrogenase
MIVYDDVEPTEKIKVYDKGVTVNGTAESAHQFRIGYRAGDMWAPHLPAKEALQAEAEHFIECVCSGASPVSGGMAGLQVVEILEAASRSIAEQGNPVRLRNKIRAAERVLSTPEAGGRATLDVHN